MITPSGGIVYHARAARSLISIFNPHGSWNPTRCYVSSWVKEWVELHHIKNLILIGPSAGYLLAADTWSAIEHLVVIDPDRLAKWIFEKRFAISRNSTTGPAHFKWILRHDLLPYFSQSPNQFSEFLKNYDPQSTGILFFGCLGQIHLHAKEFRRSQSEAQGLVLAAVEKFKTASLHDLASVVVPKLSSREARRMAELDLKLPNANYNSNSMANLVEQCSNQLENLIAAANETNTAPDPKPLVWTDHDTYWIGNPRSACVWSLTSTQIHLLGFVDDVSCAKSVAQP